MTQKISIKSSFIPPKIFVLLKTPKNIEIQNFEPEKKGSSLRMHENIRVPAPSPLDTSDYTFSVRRQQFLQDIWLKSKTFVAFPCVVTSTGPGGFMFCVCIL